MKTLRLLTTFEYAFPISLLVAIPFCVYMQLTGEMDPYKAEIKSLPDEIVVDTGTAMPDDQEVHYVCPYHQ